MFRKPTPEQIARAREMRPEGWRYIMTAAALLGIGTHKMFDMEPIARLFGMSEVLIANILITIAFYKIAGAVPTEPVQRKRKQIIYATLLALIFSPATIVWQFFNIRPIIRELKRDLEFKGEITGGKAKNRIALLWLGWAGMAISLTLFIVANFMRME